MLSYYTLRVWSPGCWCHFFYFCGDIFIFLFVIVCTESFRQQYLSMLEVMATSQYHDQILSEIKVQSVSQVFVIYLDVYVLVSLHCLFIVGINHGYLERLSESYNIVWDIEAQTVSLSFKSVQLFSYLQQGVKLRPRWKKCTSGELYLF